MEAEDENKDTTHDRYLHDGAATVSNASVKWLLQNRHYLGDEFYPAIINRQTFDAAEAERLCRLGLQYRYQQGKVQVCTNRFLGYDKDKEGKLIINLKEAEIVKRIYREYLEGRSYYDIGKGAPSGALF